MSCSRRYERSYTIDKGVMKNFGRKHGIQAALISAVSMGCIPIFGKQALLFGFAPLFVVAIRTLIAAVLMLLIMLVFQKQFFYIYPVGLVGCALAGFINGLGSILYYVAQDRMGASVGHMLYSFYPVFLALWLFLDRQSVTRITAFRLLLSIPGVYFLIGGSSDPVDLMGTALMLGSSILYALHLLINQRVLYEVPAPTVTLYTLLSMSITVLAAFLIFDHRFPTPSVNLWPVLIMAFFTFVSRLTLFMGVKHLGSIQTALLGLSEVFVTVVLAQYWLGEHLTTMQWIGAGILATCMLLVGFDRFTPAKRNTTGWLSWLNPPRVHPTDVRWQ